MKSVYMTGIIQEHEVSMSAANKPKILFYLQRGGGQRGSTKFAVAQSADGGGGMLSMEAFAESLNTNLYDSEIQQRIICNWDEGTATVKGVKPMDLSQFYNDLHDFNHEVAENLTLHWDSHLETTCRLD